MTMRDTLTTLLERYAGIIAAGLLALAWTDIALIRFTALHLPVIPFAVLAVVLLLSAGLRNTSSRHKPARVTPKSTRIIAGLSLLTWLAYCYAWWTQTGWTVGDAAWYLLLASSTILDFAGSAASPHEDAFPIAD